MNKENIKRHIDAIIENTFTVLKEVYCKQKEGFDNQHPHGENSRIIFPQYSTERKTQKGETRLSEQELRFIFVEQFNKYCNNEGLKWFYSVETPTKFKYRFSENGHNIDPIKAEDGQSAMMDLAIHDEKFNRIALIEFKALNPDASCFKKDFIKLSEEPEALTYFIMYIKTHDAGTINNLKLKVEAIGNQTKFYCYDLAHGRRIDNEIRS